MLAQLSVAARIQHGGETVGHRKNNSHNRLLNCVPRQWTKWKTTHGASNPLLFSIASHFTPASFRLFVLKSLNERLDRRFVIHISRSHFQLLQTITTFSNNVSDDLNVLGQCLRKFIFAWGTRFGEHVSGCHIVLGYPVQWKVKNLEKEHRVIIDDPFNSLPPRCTHRNRPICDAALKYSRSPGENLRCSCSSNIIL